MFRNRILDRSIILKHRLRPHEEEYFEQRRLTATKIIVPIDAQALRLGARYIFVGQKNFDAQARSLFAGDLEPGTPDRLVLELIDALPALDPFLLREQLRRHDHHPAEGYFSVSGADTERMRAFVAAELDGLVRIANRGKASELSSAKLIEKLLSARPEDAFEPLRRVLDIDREAYAEGVFAWRGFLYYKWVASELQGALDRVRYEMKTARTVGAKTREMQMAIGASVERLDAAVAEAWRGVRASLLQYDEAFGGLVDGLQATAFRFFLMRAPVLFASLGEEVGILQHIASFWRFRTQADLGPLTERAIADILEDFERSLGLDADPSEPHWPIG